MKSIFLLFLLFVCTSLVSAQKKSTEYTMHFDVPENSEFRAKNDHYMTITSTIVLANGEKIKWELFFNSKENKPQAIDFIFTEFIPLERLSAYLEQITKGNFWELVSNCLAGDFIEATTCIHNLSAFEELNCLIQEGKNCNK